MERLDSVAQDLKLALRSLSRRKLWTAVALITLALGIGANSALFTIVNAVLLRPLPYPHAERLVSLSESDKGVDLSVVSNPMYAEWSRSARSFSAIAAYGTTRALVQGPNAPEPVTGLLATASYFQVMGVRPALGRVFTADEDRIGGPFVVVLSDKLWRRLFGGDPSIVGRTVILDEKPQTVIGIMPASFATAYDPQYWMPQRIDPTPPPGTTFFYGVIGRLRPGVSIAAARAELTALAGRVDAERREDERGHGAVVMTLQQRRYGDTRPALLILLGAVGVLLLIACANVCNLLLARGARRQMEFAVRIALGASRWRLVRSLLIESVVLSLGGGVLGLLAPLFAVSWFVRLAPITIAKTEGIQVDATVLGFTFAVAVVTGVLAGLVPALEAGRGYFREIQWSLTPLNDSPRQHRVGRALIVFELATALVLLTCAGLLTRSFARVLAIDIGFRPEGVLIATIERPRTRYSDESAAPFFRDLLERARGLPGVESAALATGAPLERMGMGFSIRREGGRQTPIIELIAVSPGYFATLGTPFVGGRDFSRDDRAGHPPVAIVNETLARMMYAGAAPLRQRILLSGAPGGEATIVGVVKDASRNSVEEEPRPTVFVPREQNPRGADELLLIRTRDNPIMLQRSVQQIVRGMDNALPAPNFRTLEQVLSADRAPRQFSFVLLALFAALAATLAAVGLYGVMAYLVADRTREIGIRLALGAEPRRLVRFVVGQGMELAVFGVIIGVVGSLAAVRLLRHMLFGVSIYDPWTFAAGAALLASVALAACWVPARRAARIDPIVALRAD